MIEHGDLILFFRAAQLLPWSGISQMSREHLEQAAERFFDELNTDHARQIKAAVYSMKKRARRCLANLGGTFKGRRI